MQRVGLCEGPGIDDEEISLFICRCFQFFTLFIYIRGKIHRQAFLYSQGRDASDYFGGSLLLQCNVQTGGTCV